MPRGSKNSKPATRVRERRKWWITDYVRAFKAAVGCVECGWNQDHVGLSFDHLIGPKKGNVSELLDRRWEVICTEIRKCAIVCLYHHQHRTNWRNPGRRDLDDPDRRTSFMFGRQEYDQLEQRLLRDYRRRPDRDHARRWRERETRRVFERDKVLTVSEWVAVLELQWQEGRQPSVLPSHYLDPRWIRSDVA